MSCKIFVTPFWEASDTEILKIIEAGADSARIHTGKTDQKTIERLTRFYNKEQFKFYLDLRGNKPQVEDFIASGVTGLGEHFLEVKPQERVDFVDYKLSTKKAPSKIKTIKMTFLPPALESYQHGHLTIDDGNLTFKIIGVDFNLGIVKTIAETVKNKVFYFDGISATDFPFHSFATAPFSPKDIEILKQMTATAKKCLHFVAISFCENPKQILKAQEILWKLGFPTDVQVVPKLETICAVQNCDQICTLLHNLYGEKAELQIGRSDLSLDCLHYPSVYDLNTQIINIITVAKRHEVKVSVLAMILQSARQIWKANPNNDTPEPTIAETALIKQLLSQQVYQIGLTNEMYIDRAERMVKLLKSIIKQ
jgi:pyruvate kinase